MAITPRISLAVAQLSVQIGNKRVLDNINFEIESGHHLAILGAGGSGKTTLGKVLAGIQMATGTITYSEHLIKHRVWIPQQHVYKNKANITDFYYQQRFNSIDNDAAPTVLEYLDHHPIGVQLLDRLQLTHLADSSLLLLSNGEHKKIQMIKALSAEPKVIIMDQPFIGLDHQSRLDLHTFFDELSQQGILMVLITSSEEIPSCINDIIVLEHGQIKSKGHRSEIILPARPLSVLDQRLNMSPAIQLNALSDFHTAIAMKEITIQYGTKKILDRVSWSVARGERWLLSGPNGSGKSTLLSLITADNPQAYACDLTLFDRRRGSGESIWDIKKKIGYLSPELHVCFDLNCTVHDTIASGWFDTIGLYQKVSKEQHQTILNWLSDHEILVSHDKKLYEISFGQQRLVLLIRALIKNPTLLILDEPCQGLDDLTQSKMLACIDMLCHLHATTLVYVTHYTTLRPACITLQLALHQGRVVYNGPLALP